MQAGVPVRRADPVLPSNKHGWPSALKLICAPKEGPAGWRALALERSVVSQGGTKVYVCWKEIDTAGGLPSTRIQISGVAASCNSLVHFSLCSFHHHPTSTFGPAELIDLGKTKEEETVKKKEDEQEKRRTEACRVLHSIRHHVHRREWQPELHQHEGLLQLQELQQL